MTTPASCGKLHNECLKPGFQVQLRLHDQTGESLPPVFFGRLFLATVGPFGVLVALKDIVEQTVTGLGYDLVEIERSAGGLLRITIDLPWQGAAPTGPEMFVTVEDCEKVTRQLQYALEVDEIDYRRLEVSSPGIDRPLRHQQDFERFVGQVVDITLKQPLGSAAAGQVSVNRKKFRGVLERVEPAAGAAPAAEPAWQIVWRDEPALKPGQKVSKKRPPAPLQALGFVLSELKEARLAPIVNFKGRAPAGEAASPSLDLN